MHLIKYTLIYMQTTNSDWRQHCQSTITGFSNLGNVVGGPLPILNVQTSSEIYLSQNVTILSLA